MKMSAKNVMKVAGAVCAATGIAMLSALAASGAAAGAVVEGFKAAGDAMKKLLSDEAENGASADGQPNEESIAEEGDAR